MQTKSEKPGIMLGIVGTILALSPVVILAGLLVYATEARPHDALPTAANPLGWSYGWDCCSLMDCRAVPADAIEETPQGYRIKATGEVLPYNSPKLRDSKDEDFHWCSKGGSPTGDTICLYRAPRGF